MATAVESQGPTQPHDLLFGILAGLARSGVETFKTTDKVLHASFAEALEVFKQAGGSLGDLAESYYPDIVTDTYDELNHALIAAQGFNLLRFPNPSYSRLQLTIPPDAAEKLLNRYPAQREVFERAAEAMLRRLRG